MKRVAGRRSPRTDAVDFFSAGPSRDRWSSRDSEGHAKVNEFLLEEWEEEEDAAEDLDDASRAHTGDGLEEDEYDDEEDEVESDEGDAYTYDREDADRFEEKDEL